MPRHNAKGRSKHTRHIRIDYWILQTAAWRSLTPREIAIFLILLERYNGSNNGRIGLSVRDAAHFGHMSRNTASAAINTLIEKGFIERAYQGYFSPTHRHASEYELTHVKCGEISAKKTFAKWRENNFPVAKRRSHGIKLGPPSHEGVM